MSTNHYLLSFRVEKWIFGNIKIFDMSLLHIWSIFTKESIWFSDFPISFRSGINLRWFMNGHALPACEPIFSFHSRNALGMRAMRNKRLVNETPFKIPLLVLSFPRNALFENNLVFHSTIPFIIRLKYWWCFHYLILLLILNICSTIQKGGHMS